MFRMLRNNADARRADAHISSLGQCLGQYI